MRQCREGDEWLILIGTARLLPGLILLAVWPAVLLTVLLMLWWYAVGIVGWFGGPWIRFHLGRWLSAYLFSWSVVLVLIITALFHANATGVWTRAWFRADGGELRGAPGPLQELKKMGRNKLVMENFDGLGFWLGLALGLINGVALVCYPFLALGRSTTSGKPGATTSIRRQRSTCCRRSTTWPAPAPARHHHLTVNVTTGNTPTGA